MRYVCALAVLVCTIPFTIKIQAEDRLPVRPVGKPVDEHETHGHSDHDAHHAHEHDRHEHDANHGHGAGHDHADQASEHDQFRCGTYGGSFWDELFAPAVHTHFSRRGTPLVHLFFLEPAALHRDLFVDYRIGNNVDGNTDEQELEAELEWAFTKRLGMIIEVPFLSLDPTAAANTTGFGDIAVAGRALLIDGETFMFAANLEVSAPTGDDTRGLGDGEANLTPSVSLWQDLGDWLSFHAQIGPEIGLESGQTNLEFAFALTKSFQGPDLGLKCHHSHHSHHDHHYHYNDGHADHLHFEPGLTSFLLEFTGATGLSGPDDGDTFLEMTPGITYVPWELTELRFGVRFPIYKNERLDNQFIFSYIRNF